MHWIHNRDSSELGRWYEALVELYTCPLIERETQDKLDDVTNDIKWELDKRKKEGRL